MSKTTKKSMLIPLLIVGSMNAVLGFALGVNAFFIPFVQQAFNVTTSMSYLIMVATFSAYLIFGVFTGPILTKAGYKRGMVIALLLMAVGFLLVVPSAKTTSFPLFLTALFINGLVQALLTGAYSTYVSIMGICAKVFYAAASFILAIFIDLADVEIGDTIVPFYVISAVLLVMGLVYYFSPLPEVKAIGEDPVLSEKGNDSAYADSKRHIWQFPHLLLGVAAIFFTVGVEYLGLSTINDYARSMGLPNPQNYVWLVSAAMILGYLAGMLLIPNCLSQTNALVASTILGMTTTLVIVLIPGAASIYFVPVLRSFMAGGLAACHCRSGQIHQSGFLPIGNGNHRNRGNCPDLRIFSGDVRISDRIYRSFPLLPFYFLLCVVGQ